MEQIILELTFLGSLNPLRLSPVINRTKSSPSSLFTIDKFWAMSSGFIQIQMITPCCDCINPKTESNKR